MIKIVVLGILIAFALSAASSTAFAQRTHRQSGTWQGRNGNSGNWNREAATQAGRRDIHTGATDSLGRTAERNRSVEKTGTGTANVSTDSRGFGGRTLSTDGTAVRTENGTSSSGTWTTGSGRSGTYSRETTRGSAKFQR